MKPIGLIALTVLWTYGTYWSGYNTAVADHAPDPVVAQAQAPIEPTTFTSQDVWSAVNDYRADQGIAPLAVYAPLCDNLVARYNAIKASSSHDGFQEFIDVQVGKGMLPYDTDFTEVFASGNTASDTVQAWAGSMGHELAITSHTKGCAYSLNNLSIILMTD